MKAIALFLLTYLISLSSFAGVFEISASASYRKSEIDAKNYQLSSSYTGSVSYYFLELSALELSYTQGASLLKASTTDEDLEYRTNFSMVGADLVFSLAARQSFLQPFVKVGIAQISKEIKTLTSTGSYTTPESTNTVPSAGLGMKILFTKQFSIKLGLDGWITNFRKENEVIDYAGRAGISWMF